MWRRYLLDTEEIVFTGLVLKKKGLFSKKRQLILTDFPRFVYVDPEKLVLKGEIAWSKEIWAEAKNDRLFWIHTPKRIYYITAVSATAKNWIDEITRMKDRKSAAKT